MSELVYANVRGFYNVACIATDQESDISLLCYFVPNVKYNSSTLSFKVLKLKTIIGNFIKLSKFNQLNFSNHLFHFMSSLIFSYLALAMLNY